ncbi:MAG: hypothetical protein ACE5K9_11880 [Candidatus Methylomirabilales bacterium]
MTEPDVTLTDYGLAVECAVLSYLLYRHGDAQQPLRFWFAVFFGSVGLAALTGGTVHGFFLDAEAWGARILWPLTLLAIGVSALAAWAIGARIQFSERAARWITIAAAVEFAGYGAVVLRVTREFQVAIINYVPAAVFLLIVFFLAHRRHRRWPVLVGLAGLALTFVASWVQQSRVALHPIYVNHNALYHLIQTAALLMIFWGARWFTVRRVAE